MIYQEKPPLGDNEWVMRRAHFKRSPDSLQPFQERLMDSRPEVDTAACVDYMLEKLSFEPENEHWITEKDPLHELAKDDDHEEGLLRRSSAYLAKAVKERLKGKNEAASYGWGKIGDTEVEIFAMHYGHIRGSVGTVVGEKFSQALRDAKEHRLPLVIFDPSGGIRQQEGMIGLDWMNMMTPDLANFVEETKLPVILFSMDSFGGTPGSIEGQVSVRGGMAGTDRDFSGPRVHEFFQGGVPLKPGAQSMEKAYLDRKVHMLARGPDEILSWLEQFFKIYKNDPNEKFVARKVQHVPIPETTDGYHRTIRFGSSRAEDIIEALMPENQRPTISIELPDQPEEDSKSKKADLLYERYRQIMTNPARPDSEMFIRGMFTDVVPLYNPTVKTEYRNDTVRIFKEYPKIIAAIGRLGNRTIGILANQNSYVCEDEKQVTILPSHPTDADLDFAIEMGRFFESQAYPLFSLVNTPGANPGVDPVGISHSIAALHNYAHPTFTLVHGAHSSGGAAASAPMQDWRTGTERSIFVVADPYAQAVILNPGETPNADMVKEQLLKGAASAQDNFKLGKIDEIIRESTNPYITIRAAAEALAHYLEKQDGKSPAQLAEHRARIREKRLRAKVR